MTITAKVICDSICKQSKIRITTLELEYPITHSNFRGWVQFRHLIKGESVPG